MIAEHDRIVLTVDLPEYHLRAGDIGTVVHIYADRSAYEIEFVTLAGRTVNVVTVSAGDLRQIRENEIASARPLN